MRFLVFLLVIVGMLGSCSPEKTVIQEADQFVTISGINDTQWTYISLSTGKIVGTSAFNSVEEDALWYYRTDWDLAVCGKYIRTNSGTSGIGQGGIQSIVDKSFDELLIVPHDEFRVDSYQE